MITADLIKSSCPYCGEPIKLLVDASAGLQHYIEDCEVCCRPIEIFASTDNSGEIDLSLRTEND